MWIKFDLHVYSQDSSYTGSNISDENDLTKLLILQKNKIKVACFSDHDNFYIQNYIERLEIIKKNNINIMLLPGLEVNLRKHNNQIGQAIFVFNPDSNLEELSKLTTKEFKFNSNKYSYKNAVELFRNNNFDFMVFPHAGKGKDNMEWEDIQDSQVDALDVTDFNSSNKKKILKNKNIPIVYFSDTHTWRKYPQYGKYCSYVDVDDKNNFSYEEIKRKINENKLDKEEVIFK